MGDCDRAWRRVCDCYAEMLDGSSSVGFIMNMFRDNTDFDWFMMCGTIVAWNNHIALTVSAFKRNRDLMRGCQSVLDLQPPRRLVYSALSSIVKDFNFRFVQWSEVFIVLFKTVVVKVIHEEVSLDAMIKLNRGAPSIDVIDAWIWGEYGKREALRLRPQRPEEEEEEAPAPAPEWDHRQGRSRGRSVSFCVAAAP